MASLIDNAGLRRAFIVCVLSLAFYQFAENTTDIDLWGHVAFGQEWLATGKLATAEPYSWTAPGHRWINHENLAEISLALAHHALGGTGLLLLKVMVGLATFLIAIRTAGRTGLVAWAFGALAVVEISFGFAARPQIFTALALSGEFWLLKQIHAGRRHWMWALPPLFLVWINTHGGALAGIVLLIAAACATTTQTLVGRFIPSRWRNRLEFKIDFKAVACLWVVAGISAAALLANPYGWELIRWLVGSVLWLRPEIAEWNPVPLTADHAAFFLCMLIAAASFLFSHKRVALWELGILGALGFMACRSMRHTPLFCVASLAFVPPHLADVLDRYQESFSRLLAAVRQPQVARAFTVLLGVMACAIGGAAFTLHKERGWTMEVPRRQYPVGAIEFVKQYGLHGNLLVYFDWGEMCIWELPDSRVSVDGRLDTCYPRDVIAAHWKAYLGDDFDEAVLPLAQADFALVPSYLAGAQALVDKHGWLALYVDDIAAVLVRKPEQFSKLAFLKLSGQSLPVTGPPEKIRGRAAFPQSPSARITSR